jgi:Calcium-dependent channel, 7TM region, putative phosphate
VILQAFGVMPLQLLNLGVIIPRMFYRAFITRTPRGLFLGSQFLWYIAHSSLDFAELNAPPMVNYGTVYPQAILIFVVTLVYSVIQPLIVFFGAAYFGIAYVVYKYKLLFGTLVLHFRLFCSCSLAFSILQAIRVTRSGVANHMPSPSLGRNDLSDLHDWHLYFKQVIRLIISHDTADSIHIVLGMDNGSHFPATILFR